MNRSHTSIQVKIDRLKLRHKREQKFAVKSRRVKGILNPMHGKPAWSKGKTKTTNESLAKAALKLSSTRKQMSKDGLLPNTSGENNPMYGRDAWNSGLTKFTDERMATIARLASERKKLEWENMTEQQKDLRRQHCAQIGAQKKAFTSIEVKIHEFLDKEKIQFIKGYPIGFYVCDIYLPQLNLIIECQGDYWHGNPLKYKPEELNETQKKNQHRDKAKRTYLRNRNIRLVEFWETDIKQNFVWVEEQIKTLILEQKCASLN
jgi:very-short-patch-repair endonuclease